MLRRGTGAFAAIAAPPSSSPDGVLSFGLIWLDYLRRRDPDLSIPRLVLFLPAGTEKTTCLRLRYLSPDIAGYSVYLYDPDGQTQAVDLADYGNLDTHLDPVRRTASPTHSQLHQTLSVMPGIDVLEAIDGSLRYRAHGLPFASVHEGEVTFGLETKRRTKASNVAEIQALASHLLHFRSPQAEDRHHPLFERYPEAWLESQVRAHLPDLDASLCPTPVYGQVPAFVAGDRGVLDLLAADHAGRLTVIELKATQDIHLPLQALDYWMRVKWHLDHREFSPAGYFPQVELSPAPPRILLVAPALEFHPTTERVLRFISPQVPVERLGVAIEWQKQLKVLSRIGTPCRSPSSKT